MSPFERELLTVLVNLFLISFPQNLANIIFLHVFNKKRIIAKKFWLAMLVSWAAIYLIRSLPIDLAIASLLSMVTLIIVGVYFLKFLVNKTIISVFIIFIITLALEVLNIFIYMSIWGEEKFNLMDPNSLIVKIVGVPSCLLLFIISVLAYYIVVKKRKEGSADGEPGEKDS